jgi:UMF1 family MFS transporter
MPRLAAAAWVLYDLANTIYAASLTFLVTPWFRDQSTALGVTQTLSMLVAAVLVPALGALCDRTARTRGYLAITTLLCIAAMAGWALPGGMAWVLLCLFVANITYNLGLLFYNALLPSVAREHEQGRLSGIGVGIGYVGTLLVVVVLLQLEGSLPEETRLGHAALGFLLFALPCLLLVRERRAPEPGPAGAALRSALASLRGTLKALPGHRSLLFFLLANFCLVDVMNTAILFFAAFTADLFAAAAEQGTLALFGRSYAGEAGGKAFVAHMGLGLNVLALLFGVLLGLLTDRRPLLVLRLSGAALLLALAGGALFGGVSALGYALTLVLLGALGLAGVWTSGRKVVLLLAPADRVGEYFGLYGITLKLSVVGSAVFAIVDDSLGIRAAMLVQAVPLVLGLLFLSLVRLPPRGDAAAA